jgi:hypothetical protein
LTMSGLVLLTSASTNITRHDHVAREATGALP